jgi:hypothetical protein
MDWIDLAVDCMNNSKMNLREIGWIGMDWIDLAEHRRYGPVKGSCKHGNEPSDPVKYCEILE